jgi:hypothetical protein
MPAQRNLIEYPTPNELHWINCGDVAYLAPYGFAQGVHHVRLVLKENGVQIAKATLELMQPGADGFWSLAFERVILRDNPFQVDMELSDLDTGQSLATIRGLEVPKRALQGHTSIGFPLPSSNPVPPSFTAQGPTDQSGGLSAKLFDTAHGPFNSPATISGQAFFAVFQQVPGALDYTLQALEGTTVADSKNPIKVS